MTESWESPQQDGLDNALSIRGVTMAPSIQEQERSTAEQVKELTYEPGESKKVSMELKKLRNAFWKKDQPNVDTVRRLRTKSLEEVYTPEQIRGGFRPLERGAVLFVTCSDGRCNSERDPAVFFEQNRFKRFASPGSFVLIDNERELEKETYPYLRSLMASGVDIVYICGHDHCGAEAAKCELNAKEGKESDPKEVRRQLEERVTKALGLERAGTMGYSKESTEPMRGHEHIHDERMLTIDLSNRLYDTAEMSMTGFKLNRYVEDVDTLIQHALLLLGIAMDRQKGGFGRERFKEEGPFVITIVGVPGDPRYSSSAFKRALNRRLGLYRDVVEVVGFDAPDPETLKPERDAA